MFRQVPTSPPSLQRDWSSNIGQASGFLKRSHWSVCGDPGQFVVILVDAWFAAVVKIDECI